MATSGHWVDEVFPPKFKLNTSFDFGREISNRSHPTMVRDVQKIYDDVYLSTFCDGKGREVGPRLNEFVEKKVIEKDIHETLKERNEPNNGEKITKKSGTECIWSSEEMAILRKSLDRSKLNNIRLNVLARSLQKDCEHLKNICHEQARQILMWNQKYGDVRKQNRRMKITCGAFKEDIKKCSADLEESQRHLQEAVSQKENYESELLCITKEFEVTCKKNKNLKLELESQRRLHEQLMKNQKDTLELIQAKAVHKLTGRLKQTERELEKEKNDHCITKKALEHLRLHFASGIA